MEPADIINRALDEIGRPDLIIGDPEEGTEGSKVALRSYTPALLQLLRAAHWDFARKVSPLQMLADASGQTPDVGTAVIAPWVYEYAYPTDCVKARFLPWNYINVNTPVPTGNAALPDVPLTTVSQPPYVNGGQLLPAPFLLSSDYNYPVDVNSNWQNLQGVSPSSRTVILSNVNQANLVYTAIMPYPSTWDPLFEQAMVSLLSVRLSLSLARDQRLGLQVRAMASAALKEALMAARVASANEGSFPQSTDIIPDYIRARASSPGYGGGNDQFSGPGYLFCGWDTLSIGNGSVF